MTPKENVLQIEPAIRAVPRPARRLGSILIEHGKLTNATAEQVGEAQRERGLRFGDAALQLKLISGDFPEGSSIVAEAAAVCSIVCRSLGRASTWNATHAPAHASSSVIAWSAGRERQALR